MTDILARMKQLIGSTAEWAANDIPLGYGEIGIERVSSAEYKAKVGDGSTKWSALPYLTSQQNTINAATQAALNAKLPLSGGTLTGPLTLSRPGANPNEPVTLAQLQAEVAKLNAEDLRKLAIAGGAMTGPLMLSKDGVAPLEAVTYQQMTKAVSDMVISASGGLTFSGTIDPTVTYAAPVPAPLSGYYYTAVKSGNVHATWTTHVVGVQTTVAFGDFFVWDGVANKFHHISNPISLNAYVPLAGTNAMVGNIVWSGAANSKSGVSIISGKGGTIDEAVIDNGTY